MIRSDHSPARDYAAMDEAALVEQVLDGDRDAFRHIMQRCNQRLFRVARAVVNDEHEAEDVSRRLTCTHTKNSPRSAATPRCSPG